MENRIIKSAKALLKSQYIHPSKFQYKRKNLEDVDTNWQDCQFPWISENMDFSHNDYRVNPKYEKNLKKNTNFI